MSSIRCKKGWWYYRYYDASGKLKERALHTRNRGIAERMKDILDRQLEANESIDAYLNATFGFIIERYLNYLSPQKSPQSVRDYHLIARRLEQYYQYPIKRIKQIHVLDMIRDLEKRYSEESVRKTLMFIKQVFRWAYSNGFITHNPTADIKYLRKRRSRRIRWFTKEELQKIFKLADQLYPHLAPAFKFMYYTGLRLSELITLQWQDIDFKNAVLRVMDSKTPKGIRRIPLNKEALKILNNLPRYEGNEFVFASPHGGSWHGDVLTKRFATILRKAGIKDASLHTLRHTFASHLAMAGVPLDVIRDLLGHGSVLITEIYAHLAPDHLKSAVDKLPNLEG